MKIFTEFCFKQVMIEIVRIFIGTNELIIESLFNNKYLWQDPICRIFASKCQNKTFGADIYNVKLII